MQYEWYIDVFFLVNFAMDVFLLLLLGMLLKIPTTLPRLLGAGTVGALGSCLAVYFWRFPAAITLIIGMILPGCMMVWLAFKPKSWRSLIKMVIMLFFEAFCIGGIMETLYQHTRVGLQGLYRGMPILIWLLLAAGSWFGFRFLWLTVSEIRRERQMLYSVTLHSGQVQVVGIGYLDTGNCLYDPEENRPVHIVSENLWKKLWRPGMACRNVWFRTIGTPLGMTEVMEIGQIEIQEGNGRKKVLQNPLVARAPFKMTKDGSYDILLHKQTFY